MDATGEIRGTLARLEELGGATSGAELAPDGWTRTPGLLRELERMLLSLSAGWQGVAAQAAPGIAALRDHRGQRVPVETGLSREQEVQLMSILHDVAADLAAAARSCRNGRSVAEPLIERRRRHRDGARVQAPGATYPLRPRGNLTGSRAPTPARGQ